MAPDIADGIMCNSSSSMKEDTRSYPTKLKQCNGTIDDKSKENKSDEKCDEEWLIFRKDIKWDMVIIIFLYHFVGLYGLLTIPFMFYIHHWKTVLWGKYFYFRNFFSLKNPFHS